jgi:hypothetical protein
MGRGSRDVVVGEGVCGLRETRLGTVYTGQSKRKKKSKAKKESAPCFSPFSISFSLPFFPTFPTPRLLLGGGGRRFYCCSAPLP